MYNIVCSNNLIYYEGQLNFFFSVRKMAFSTVPKERERVLLLPLRLSPELFRPSAAVPGVLGAFPPRQVQTTLS